MAFQITSLYASILAIAVIVLAVIVSTTRGKYGVSIMDGGHSELALWIRRHGNFAEAVPFALFMMALAEARGMPPIWLHGIGIVLIVARLAHVVGLNVASPNNPVRIAGTVGTHLCMLAAAGYLFYALA